MWEGVGDRVSRESIWDIVQNTLSSEVVGHDPAFETLEAWVLDFVQPVIVEYWYEGVVIGNSSEMGETCKE